MHLKGDEMDLLGYKTKRVRYKKECDTRKSAIRERVR